MERVDECFKTWVSVAFCLERPVSLGFKNVSLYVLLRLVGSDETS